MLSRPGWICRSIVLAPASVWGKLRGETARRKIKTRNLVNDKEPLPVHGESHEGHREWADRLRL